ncbi:MAG: hypothetical protein AAFU54_19890 [Chloroflexota bacterium]
MPNPYSLIQRKSYGYAIIVTPHRRLVAFIAGGTVVIFYTAT